LKKNIKKKIQTAFKLIHELEPKKGRLMNPVPKSFNPFWNHPYNVLKNVIQLGCSDEDTLISAILHDVLEDTNYPPKKLEEEFGVNVLEIVKAISKSKNYTKANSHIYYKGIYEHPDLEIREKACFIKFADRMDNLSEAVIITDNDFVKQYFEETKKYFPKIAKVIGKEQELKIFLKHVEILMKGKK
jgi:(p)ppGpp synthase/HD superfamily hydrolase